MDVHLFLKQSLYSYFWRLFTWSSLLIALQMHRSTSASASFHVWNQPRRSIRLRSEIENRPHAQYEIHNSVDDILFAGLID